MLPDLHRELQKMGLRDKEAKVYLACLLHRGGLYAHEIVKETRINRSTVDVLIQRLLEQQWISRIRVGNRYKYQAQALQSIHATKKGLLDRLERFFPFIDKLNLDIAKTDVRFYEGGNGIAQLYHDLGQTLLRSNANDGPFYHIASTTVIEKVFPDYKSFVDIRIKQQIPAFILTPEAIHERIWMNNDQEFRQVKIFNGKKYNFGVNFDVFKDHLCISSPLKPVAGFMITNHQIAQSFRSLFELLWDLLPASNDLAHNKKVKKSYK